jgi:DNA-binding beta-propeller fold protein YncE
MLIDLKAQQSKKLDLNGFPGTFRPHGLEVSKRTKTIYVVNHADGMDERVEMFKYDGEGSLQNFTLRWAGAVRPPVPKLSLNSVTEASANHIYVTHWFSRDAPRKGKARAEDGGEKLNASIVNLELIGFRFLGLPAFAVGNTNVYLCTFPKKECTVAYSNFISANGIASDPEGKFVFVNDCARQDVSVFSRDAQTGALTLRAVHPLKHDADNVHVNRRADGKLELWFGTMPNIAKSFIAMAMHHWEMVPGGFLSVIYDPVSNTFQDEVDVQHDGSLLEDVATGAKYGNKILLGGPASAKLLMCDA